MLTFVIKTKLKLYLESFYVNIHDLNQTEAALSPAFSQDHTDTYPSQ